MGNKDKRKFTFDETCTRLKDMCIELGRIPNYEEVTRDKELPHPKTINEYFFEQGHVIKSYSEYCKSLGYIKAKKESKFQKYNTFEDLCQLWDEYFEENGVYPDGRLIRKRNHFPDLALVKQVCGDKYREFRVKYKMKIMPKTMDYDFYCEIFITESNIIGQPLGQKCLDTFNEYSYILPSSRWFIVNCPDNNVNNYNSFIEYLGFKPRYLMSKELASKLIYEKAESLGRNPMAKDFTIHDHLNELGIQTIRNHWGTFNKMLIELGFDINWQSYGNTKSLEEMQNDIRKLCENIYINENRRIIGYDDVNNSDFCFPSGVYSRKFQKEINMTLADYIRFIGFIPNDCGKGMNHKFEDGEVTKSQFEFLVSNYLREKGLVYGSDYLRDVHYKKFVSNGYIGNKNIDYIIFDKWYIEVAGVVLQSEQTHKTRKSILNYKLNLNDKIEMLIESKLNYKIIYPEDLKRPLDDVFSFLFEENRKVI